MQIQLHAFDLLSEASLFSLVASARTPSLQARIPFKSRTEPVDIRPCTPSPTSQTMDTAIMHDSQPNHTTIRDA